MAPYADRKGEVWPLGPNAFYAAQQATAEKAGIEWKANALRHSYVSYRFAQIGDSGHVAGECGNRAAIVPKHYREWVTPADAGKWFSIRPQTPANVLPLTKDQGTSIHA